MSVFNLLREKLTKGLRGSCSQPDQGTSTEPLVKAPRAFVERTTTQHEVREFEHMLSVYAIAEGPPSCGPTKPVVNNRKRTFQVMEGLRQYAQDTTDTITDVATLCHEMTSEVAQREDDYRDYDKLLESWHYYDMEFQGPSTSQYSHVATSEGTSDLANPVEDMDQDGLAAYLTETVSARGKEVDTKRHIPPPGHITNCTFPPGSVTFGLPKYDRSDSICPHKGSEESLLMPTHRAVPLRRKPLRADLKDFEATTSV